MDLQKIRYFLVLAEELHFWRTAERVFISQSSLSRHMQALEEELGIRLLERDKRNVKLTDAGKFLQQQWRVKVRELDHIQSQAKKISEGEAGGVSITYPGSIAFKFLPLFLDNLNSKLPNLKIELTEPNDENHEKLLLDYKADLAFGRDRITNSSIETYKLYSEPVCLIVPKAHWLTQENFVSLKDLQSERFILSGLHQKTFFASFLRNLFYNYDFEPQVLIESDFGGMILSLVSKGLGITILPSSFSYAKAENVRFIELDEEIGLYMNWRKDELNKAIDRVVQCGKETAMLYSEM